MKINMVDGPPDLVFNTLVHTPPDARLTEYLAHNVSRVQEYASHLGQQFVDSTMQMYESINNSDIINAGKAILHSVQTHLDPTVIYPVSMENLPQANYAMQRYIMVQPELRELHDDQLCNGFQETYFDVDPDAESYREHTDYRRVMDGMIQYEDDSDDGNLYFYTDTITDDEELHIIDKISIMDTWDNVALAIAKGIDPSDPDGGEL